MVYSHQLLAKPLRVFSRPSIASLLSPHRERPTRQGTHSIAGKLARKLECLAGTANQEVLGIQFEKKFSGRGEKLTETAVKGKQHVEFRA
jgi:hypothetical protein